jgi:large conductance mechanosensitive channel
MDPVKSVRSLADNQATQQAFSLWSEFKKFAFKGNVIDLAVGVVIGGAFGKIVDSLVKQVIMPLISVLIPSEQGYLAWKWEVSGKEIPYGLFVGEVVNFLVIAGVLFFFVVKFLGWIVRSKQAEAAAAPPPLTKDQELLIEIRDLLSKRA